MGATGLVTISDASNASQALIGQPTILSGLFYQQQLFSYCRYQSHYQRCLYPHLPIRLKLQQMANGVGTNDISTLPHGLPPSQVPPICIDHRWKQSILSNRINSIHAHIGSRYVQLPPFTGTSNWSTIKYIKCFAENPHVTAQ